MKYSKIEFGIATVFFIVALIVAYNSGELAYYNHNNTRLWIGHFIFPRVLVVAITYCSFLALNYLVLPKYLFKKKYFEGVGLTLVIFALAVTCFTVYFSYVRDWEYDLKNLYNANLSFFSYGMIMANGFLFIYAVYVAIREGIAYQYKMTQQGQSLSSRIKREIILVLSIWLAIIVPLWSYHNFPTVIIFFFSFCLPYCFIVYFLNLYWLIPQYKRTQSPILRYILNLLAAVSYTHLTLPTKRIV